MQASWVFEEKLGFFLSLLFIFWKCLLVWGGLHLSPAT